MMRDRRNRLLPLLALALLGAAVSPSAVSARSGSIARLQVQVGGFCIDGRGEPRTRHTITLRAPDGAFRAQGSSRSDVEGRFFICPSNGGITLANPGDVLTLRTVEGSETHRVTDVRPRINRRSDVIWGHGPRDSTVRVRVHPRTGAVRTWNVPVDDRGIWRIDTSGELDILGADGVEVRLRRGDDLIEAMGAAPYLAFGTASNLVFGAAAVGSRPTVTLSRDDTDLVSVAAVSLAGSLIVTLETPRGRAVYPRVGDVVTSTAAGGIRLRVPVARVAGDVTTDMVHLRCMADAPYTITVRDGDGFWVDLVLGRTNAEGRATRTISLRSDYILSADCGYRSGDRLLVEGIAE